MGPIATRLSKNLTIIFQQRPFKVSSESMQFLKLYSTLNCIPSNPEVFLAHLTIGFVGFGSIVKILLRQKIQLTKIGIFPLVKTSGLTPKSVKPSSSRKLDCLGRGRCSFL